MFARPTLTPIIVMLFGSLTTTASAMECNVCHSKNPAMVSMHKATQSKGISCFDCHRIGEKLMGKGQPKDKVSQLKRRSTEEICKQCHQ
jgi:hypothetical protein